MFQLPSNVSGTVSQCIAGGTGHVLDGFGTTGSSLTTSLTTAFTALGLIASNSAYDTAPLTNAQTNFTTTVSQYISSAKNDIIHDAPSLAWLQGLASQALPTACVGDPAFTVDSLVPSTASSSLAIVPCGGGKSVVACADFATCAPGCIDLNSVMLSAGSLATFQSKISTRYAAAAAGCLTAINNDLSTYYTNWFSPMTNTASGIGYVGTTTWPAASTVITGVLTGLPPVKTQLSTILNALEATAPKITDPINGLQGGLNCLMIGEDLQRIRDTLCINVFNGLFVSLVTVGLSAFGLLLSMCCIVCTGVRYYKQSEMIKANEEKELKKSRFGGEREQTMISINEYT